MALLPPIFAQNGTYSAKAVRQLVEQVGTEGVVGNGYAVTQRGAGANMSVDVEAGAAFVQGDDEAGQGAYLCVNDAVTNLPVDAADPSNPRIDIICVTVRDPNAGGQAGDDFVIEVITGTPSGVPSAPATPDSAIKIAEVAVGAAATSILNADITDFRQPTNPALMAGYTFVETEVYTASGTWTKSDYAPWLRGVIVEVVGGGGTANNIGQYSQASGAAAGGYARKWLLASALGDTETVTVGAAGVRSATYPGTGGTGGTTSFGSHVQATGGNNYSTGGTGNGDFNITGSQGGPAVGTRLGGFGGDSALGFGGMAPTGSTGFTATAYGGGGGGPGSGDGNRAGGLGTGGVVLVHHYA